MTDLDKLEAALSEIKIKYSGVRTDTGETHWFVDTVDADRFYLIHKAAADYFLEKRAHLAAQRQGGDAVIGFDMGAPEGDLSCLAIGTRLENGGLNIHHCVYGEEAEALHRALNSVPALRDALNPPAVTGDRGALEALDAVKCLATYRHYIDEDLHGMFLSHIETIRAALSAQGGVPGDLVAAMTRVIAIAKAYKADESAGKNYKGANDSNRRAIEYAETLLQPYINNGRGGQ